MSWVRFHDNVATCWVATKALVTRWKGIYTDTGNLPTLAKLSCSRRITKAHTYLTKCWSSFQHHSWSAKCLLPSTSQNTMQSKYWHEWLFDVSASVDWYNAATKAYVDFVQYKTAAGIISGADHTNHMLFTFSDGKTFVSGKIIIGKLCVEWVEEDWIATSCSLFTALWIYFIRISKARPWWHP